VLPVSPAQWCTLCDASRAGVFCSCGFEEDGAAYLYTHGRASPLNHHMVLHHGPSSFSVRDAGFDGFDDDDVKIAISPRFNLLEPLASCPDPTYILVNISWAGPLPCFCVVIKQDAALTEFKLRHFQQLEVLSFGSHDCAIPRLESRGGSLSRTTFTVSSVDEEGPASYTNFSIWDGEPIRI